MLLSTHNPWEVDLEANLLILTGTTKDKYDGTFSDWAATLSSEPVKEYVFENIFSIINYTMNENDII